jgi:hypothetical protein
MQQQGFINPVTYLQVFFSQEYLTHIPSLEKTDL